MVYFGENSKNYRFPDLEVNEENQVKLQKWIEEYTELIEQEENKNLDMLSFFKGKQIKIEHVDEFEEPRDVFILLIYFKEVCKLADFEPVSVVEKQEYRIISKNAFQVIGKIANVSAKNGEHHQRIAKLWNECNVNGTNERISSLDSEQNLLGISLEFVEESEQLLYMIAIEDVKHTADTGFDTREIPAADWAVFPSIGPMPQAIVNVLSEIYQEWLPSSSFKQATGPIIEVYPPGNPSAPDYHCEIWIPVVKKLGKH
jgi:AraC family transcriptional regulator